MAAGWLVPIAIAALYWAVQAASTRVSALFGLAFGVGFMTPLLFWLSASIAPMAWVGLSLVQATWFSLAAVGMSSVRSLPGRPIWAAAVFTAIEVLRGTWPLGGLPWGRLGFSVVDTPWDSLLPYLGITGTGFMLALLGTVLARALPVHGVKDLAVPSAVMVVTLVPGLWPITPSQSGVVRVAVVQGGVPGEGNQVALYREEITRRHVDATIELARQVDAGRAPRPDLVVWPESSTVADPASDSQISSLINTARRAVDAPLLVGTVVAASRPETALNQALIWGPLGPTERYTKRHPVPFGEYVPFRWALEGRIERLEEIPRDMLPGVGGEPIEVAGFKMANAICFDIGFDDVVGPQVSDGAGFVVVQTSNASFIGSSQLEQQFAITRARAIESGRAVAIASLNGISALVGPDGEVLQQGRSDGTVVMSGELPTSGYLTPAVRWGRVITNGVVVMAVLGLGTVFVRRRRSDAASLQAVWRPNRVSR